MPVYHYFPPGEEEQKAFVRQLFGTLLCLALAAVFFVFAPDARMRAVLIGAAAGVLWLLARAAWQLEKKARRAQNGAIEVDDEGVLLTDAHGHTQRVLWNEIERLDVRGGRLTIAWPGHEFAVGARELGNGMEFVREITRRCEHAERTPEAEQSKSLRD